MKKLLPIVFLLSLSVVHAQRIDYPEGFNELLEQANIEFYEPVEAGYRDFKPLENEWQNCHFAIRSPREKLDIRYFILPWDDDDPEACNPNIVTFSTVTNVASTDDESLISAIQPTKQSLLEEFNADWGITYFFRPKPEFSDKPNCRMMALCKEGKGTVFIFYLFDDPSNEALDVRKYALRFL